MKVSIEVDLSEAFGNIDTYDNEYKFVEECFESLSAERQERFIFERLGYVREEDIENFLAQ